MTQALIRAGLFALLLCTTATAATVPVRLGEFGLDFDGATGSLVRLSYKGDVLAQCSPAESSYTFAVGPKGAVKWLDQMGLERKLIKRAQPRPDTLELTVRVGPYEVVERYRLHAGRPRLDRSATLTWRGTEPVKLRGFAFRTAGVKATADGFYRFPGKWPPQSLPFAEMKPGARRGGRGSIAPLFAQLSPTRCLMWASYTTDTPSVSVTEGEGSFTVGQGVQAAGYLRPGEPQKMGFVTMEVVPAAYWDALPKLWDWMDSVGLKVPADRPPWVEGAILYEFHPGGTIGSGFRDLGGFKTAREKLLPTLPALGVTAIWIQPIEYRSPYWPLDYYRFMDGLGTADDYKALVRRAKELGLNVIQDLVPHGGAPHAVHNKAHPEFMLRREDGSTLNYWLNDFARPDWQDFIGKVAAHYVRDYGVEGYRVDACYGSKELNWDPKVSYARASHARMWGGLGMLKRIRDEVKKLNPKDGAILAEVESARHAAVSDFVYDFGLCYHVLHQWRKMPAAEFVPLLQDYLEEQQHVYPRGTLFLRHVESHDSLRAQGWYGVEGMRAMYALTAFIPGVPLIYLGQEVGHSFALREINDLRTSRPELARGEASYRAVKCDKPGVFTCLRTLGGKVSVVAINLGRSAVEARLRWPGGSATVHLDPLAFTAMHSPPARPDPVRHAPPEAASRATGDAVAFPHAREWFVDTVEGRLHGAFRLRQRPTKPHNSSIYWRPQGTDDLWRNDLAPLHPQARRLGVLGADGHWTIADFRDASPSDLRLVERHGGVDALHLLGYGADRPWLSKAKACPPPPMMSRPFVTNGVTLRCIGPDYIVSNDHFTCVLRRQGGVIRELRIGDRVVADRHDLYGDQDYFRTRNAPRIAAGNDVESGIRIWKVDDGLHLAFEGQLRGFNRFALKRPPLWYRNEYVFTDAPRFTQKWAFRTEKSFEGKKAFLAAFLHLPDADCFRFLRGGKPLADGPVGEGGPRRGETKGGAAPDAIEFLAGGEPGWRLARLSTPEGCACNVFVHGRLFFVALLDGDGAAMTEGRWYQFEAEWAVGAK